MQPPKNNSRQVHSCNASFHTTRWSIVWGASSRESAEAARSLEALCQQYWPPLYAFVRHRGHREHDAQDLTQAFFAKLLEKDWLTVADPSRGRFRSFLLMAMKRFLANEHEYAQAKKRGGGLQIVPTDFGGDAQFADPKGRTAEAIFDRQWAITVLQAVMTRLRSEYQEAGRSKDYERLKTCLTAERGTIDYAVLASELGVRPVSARSSVHRMRARFRQLFRDEVAGTVADAAEVEDEMKSLFKALGVDSIISRSANTAESNTSDH
jgi:DNA-directed RNA polymerase specialized sigma24 family protein